MNKKIGVLAAVGALVVLAALALGWYASQEGKQEKFRAQVQPVVKKISDRIQATAGLARSGSREALERSDAILTDLAGLGADLKAFYTEGARQEALVAAGQAYLAAAQSFVRGQQDFSRSLARLEAARAKHKESLDAKVRTSKFSMDFWKESHDRLTLALEAARKDATQARERFAAASAATQAAARAADPVLGSGVLAPDKVFADHRKALEDISLAKDS